MSKDIRIRRFVGSLVALLFIVSVFAPLVTVRAAPFISQKWVTTGLPKGEAGVITKDLDGDGYEEIIMAGNGTDGMGEVVCLDGRTGAVRWRYANDGIGEFCQPQMADLNGDGTFEIIVPIEFPPAIVVLCSNGPTNYTKVWEVSLLGTALDGSPREGSITCSPVIADIDGNGHSTIFVGREDAIEPYHGGIAAISWNGTIIAETFVYRPCSGGFSLADVNGNGTFELYVGDRKFNYGGNEEPGQGIMCLNAHTLKLVWSRPEYTSSSYAPVLIDVTGDGILDVIAHNHSGGIILVLDALTGATIREADVGAPTHYKFSVYDVDGDGNPEMLTADGSHPSTPDYVLIWDLVAWQEDARLYPGLCFYPPTVGEVTGDGRMDIIACNYTGVFIYSYNSVNKTYDLVDQITGLSGWLTYAVVQDVDNDGFNEIIVQSMDNRVYCFDTVAPSQQARGLPRARSEVQYYSERRLGVAQYVLPPGSQAPVVSNPAPLDKAQNVTVQLSRLSINLQDFQANKMNYTITTSPNIGSGSGTNVGNGIYSITVSNLAYNKTYTWKVNTTDGALWSNVTFTFTTASNALPQLYNYSYRKQITIAKVSTDLANFSVLINVTDPDLKSKALSNGQDIFFTDANLVKLSHEIELYNSANGQLVAWVKVPLLSSTTSTTLYMYYGNLTSVPPQWDPQGVWNTSYVEVHHFNGSSATALKDSTSYHNDVSGQTGTPNYNVPARIGNSVDFVPNEALTISDADTLDGYNTSATFEAWVCSDNYQLTQTVASKWGSAGSKSWFIEIQYTGSTNKILFYFTEDGSTAKYVYCTFAMQSGNWYHIAVVWKANTVPVFYINGGKQSTIGTANSTRIFAGNAREIVGSRGTNYFDGKIDELRISNVDRSAAWISTSFNSQNDPTNFCHFGAEEKLQ